MIFKFWATHVPLNTLKSPPTSAHRNTTQPTAVTKPNLVLSTTIGKGFFPKINADIKHTPDVS